MLFCNDFTPNSVQHNAVEFKRNSVRSQRTAVCSKDRFLSGAYRDFANVLICEAHTVDENSRFPVFLVWFNV